MTIALPRDVNSVGIGGLVQESGYLVSYNSDYLRARNWIQICLMGECAKEKMIPLLHALNRVCFHRPHGRTKASHALPTAAPVGKS